MSHRVAGDVLQDAFIRYSLIENDKQNQAPDLLQMKSLQPCDGRAAVMKHVARFEMARTVNTHFGYFYTQNGYCEKLGLVNACASWVNALFPIRTSALWVSCLAIQW